MRLDGDLGAVARLARNAADLDETVGDLGDLELEQRLDQLGIAAREDHLWALRPGPHLGNDGLDSLELLERTFACLVEQALLDVGRQLDRVDAEVALFVDLDGGMAGRARRLFVRGQQGVFERGNQCPALDPLLAFDVSDCVDDLLRHLAPTSSIRLPRTIESYGTSMDSSSVLTVTLSSPAATTSPRTRL